MKNPLLKVLFSAVCLFPFSPVHAQYPYVTGNALQLFQVGAPGEKKNHSPRRTPPQNVNLPEVYFDEETLELCFTETTAVVSFGYKVKDQDNNILYSGETTLEVDDILCLSMTDTESESFTIEIIIGDVTYESDAFCL